MSASQSASFDISTGHFSSLNAQLWCWLSWEASVDNRRKGLEFEKYFLFLPKENFQPRCDFSLSLTRFYKYISQSLESVYSHSGFAISVQLIANPKDNGNKSLQTEYEERMIKQVSC